MHRHILFVFAVSLFAGCADAPEVIASPVLMITPGPQTDLTLMGGTDDAELIRFDVTNLSERDVEIRSLAASIAHLDWSPVADGTVADIKFTDGRGRVRMGPQELPSGRAALGFDDAFVLHAGETETLVLRADLGTSADRLMVGAGGSNYSGPLPPPDDLRDAVIFDAVFVDSAEPVALDLIENNRELVRIVNVLPVEIMEVPENTTALVATFLPERGILTPSEDTWHLIGTLFLDSFGGDSVFRGTDVFGANIGLLGSVTLARDGIIVGEVLTPTGACSCGSVRLLEPIVVRDSERVEFQVWGRVPTTATLTGELTFGLDGSGVDAEAADGGDFSVIVSQPYESRFRVLETYPVVTPQALSTTALVNGVEQDLYKIQVGSAVAGTSLYIGSLTFRLRGFGKDGMVSGLGIRVGSSPLSRATYRIVRTSTGIELGPTDSVSGLSDQITVVFTDPDGLLISGSGHVITLTGTPSGMTSGTSLNIHFGDRIFSGTYNGVFGNMTSDGQINYADGRSVFPLVDPIVWTTRTMGGVYTGAWMISDLETISTLTRP